MGLEFLWSFGLACLDFHALRSKRSLQNSVLVSLFVVGDWVSFCTHEVYVYMHVLIGNEAYLASLVTLVMHYCWGNGAVGWMIRRQVLSWKLLIWPHLNLFLICRKKCKIKCYIS